MSDSPRWHLDGLPGTTGIVEVMLYDDHVAAVAAAGREGANQGYLNGVATNADNSFKAGIKAARDAVEWLELDDWGPPHAARANVLAAIDALTTRDEGRNTG